jgi:hypothetical protein
MLTRPEIDSWPILRKYVEAETLDYVDHPSGRPLDAGVEAITARLLSHYEWPPAFRRTVNDRLLHATVEGVFERLKGRRREPR